MGVLFVGMGRNHIGENNDIVCLFLVNSLNFTCLDPCFKMIRRCPAGMAQELGDHGLIPG